MQLVRIRLMRLGAKKKPFYRVVVADARARRNGPFIEIVGTYNPKKDPAEVNLNMERVKYWLQKGAQPSDTVKKLIEQVSA
jgi:small subunit ribosomal protein S16